MKKRLFATLFLCIALVFALPGAALAADTVEYESSELGLSFSAPADFKIVSRDSYETDPVVDELPYTQEDLDRWFTGDGDYHFFGIQDSTHCIFSLHAYPGGHERLLAAIDSGTLDSLVDPLADKLAESGIELLSAGTYAQSETGFLRFGFFNTSEDGTKDYIVSFFTAYGENTIRADFWFVYGTNTPEQNALANSIIDSMKFSSQPGSSAAPEEAAAAAAPTEAPVGEPANTASAQSLQTETTKTIVCCVLLAAVVIALYILSRKMRRDKEAAAQAMASDALPKASAAPAEAPAAPAAPDVKYCPYCGEKIPAASKFCPKCGAQLPPRSENL